MYRKFFSILSIVLLLTTMLSGNISSLSEETSSSFPLKNVALSQKQNQQASLTLSGIQKAITQKNADWTAGYNDIFSADGTYDTNLLGCTDEIIDDTTEPFTASFNDSLPDAWDWRNIQGEDWVTPIGNQRSCGSCVAFGSLGAFEAVIQIELQRQLHVDLSEAHLFFCGGGSCSGGWSVSSAVNFINSQGVPTEDCFPYSPIDMDCQSTCPDFESMAIKAADVGRVGGLPPSNVSCVQKALVEYGPLITSFTVYNDFFSYTTGVYEHVTGDVGGGHAVTIVGYNNSWGNETEGYWICKNSWGRNWGEQGFFNIKYGECGLGKTLNTYYLSDVYGGICDDYLPNTLSNPYPEHNGVNIAPDAMLQWQGGDPNLENNVTYEIYLGETDEPEYQGTIGPFPASQTQISFSSTSLKENACYYWKIIAIDDEGLRRQGPTWQFCTIDTLPPELNITSPLPGYIYKRQGMYRKQLPESWNSIIIGPIMIEVQVFDQGSGLASVDLFIDNRLQTTFSAEDWQWLWQRMSLGRHTLRFVAKDRSDNQISEEITFWKFF